jgi:hypothetical protein
MEMNELTRDHLIKKAKELAQADGKPYVKRLDFMRRTGISEYHVLKHFDSWTDFFQQAGLEPQATQPLEEEQLLEAAKTAFLEIGDIPTFSRFSKAVPYSWNSYQRRWGTWPAFFAAFRNWIVDKYPSWPLLDKLDSHIESTSSAKAAAVTTLACPSAGTWESTEGRRLGRFLNFRGLQHAPINEQGVVLLFGMVAFELGYMVESVATGFPDCEAKRRIKGPSEAWERIRIEFEYESKNFLNHGHDAEQCDVIVCWQHNWPECPIEVLQLSSAIRDLDEDEVDN